MDQKPRGINKLTDKGRATADPCAAEIWLTPETFFADYAQRVYRLSLRLCGGNPADAEDLAQDVLLAAWRAREDFQGRSEALTYLYKIAVNRCLRLRSRGDAANKRERAAIPEPAARFSDVTVARIELERALATLPDELRAAFLIVKSEGLTYREASRILEIPQGTLQSRVHEAVLRLRVLLSDVAEPGPVITPCDPLPQPRKENCHAL